MPFARVLGALVCALLVAVAPAGAHPEHFEAKRLLNHWQLGLPPGPPGPAPAVSPRSSTRNVEVLGHADPGGGFNADVVAHRGYAYLGSWGTAIDQESYELGTYCPARGVRVYSLFNLGAPAHVATFADGASNPELAGSWTEKVIVQHVNTAWFRGELAAVSFQDCRHDAFRGIGLYDVSDPANPVELGLLDVGFIGVHELWLQPIGNRAYVYTAAIFEEVDQYFTTGVPGNPDFRVIDVSNPRAPVQVGSWGAWEELGIEPVDGRGSFPFNFVHSVYANESGNRTFLSYWDNGTVILDTSDPAHPRYLGRTSYGPDEEGNAHSSWLAHGGKVLIQTDEDFDPFPFPGTETSWGYARFYDISDPAAPVALSTFELPTTTQSPPPPGYFTVHDPKVRGSSAYFSWYSEGVVVVDVSRPAKPRFVAQFVPPPAGDPNGIFAPPELEFPNVWGVDIERNYALASDINSGLWVFRVR